MVLVSDVVRVPVTPEMIERARYTAMKKAPNLANTWQERDIVRKYTDLYPGDLAALAVEALLRKNSLKVINYDVYRVESGIDPEFKKPAKWDLLVCDKFYIEVKSSLEKKFDLSGIENVVRGRRIMCYPRREVQIHVQVYYLSADPSLCRKVETSSFQSYEESDNLLQKLENAYIMAWATREDLGGAPVVELYGLTLLERPRGYRDFYIWQGRPIHTLLVALAKWTCSY